MDEWCAEVGSRPLSWAKWTDGIYPDYRALAEKAVRADSVKLHEYVAHILSSQALAFNLFCHSGKAVGRDCPSASAR